VVLPTLLRLRSQFSRREPGSLMWQSIEGTFTDVRQLGNDPPPLYVCPITYQVMTDPVTAADGCVALRDTD
jgi:hypothetical protein